jgi:hypothetical protein
MGRTAAVSINVLAARDRVNPTIAGEPPALPLSSLINQESSATELSRISNRIASSWLMATCVMVHPSIASVGLTPKVCCIHTQSLRNALISIESIATSLGLAVIVLIQYMIRNTIDTAMISVNSTLITPSWEAIWTTAEIVLIDTNRPVSKVIHTLRMCIEMHRIRNFAVEASWRSVGEDTCITVQLVQEAGRPLTRGCQSNGLECVRA